MEMMINRRRAAGRLPYDAEVEYLQSNGTEYIDVDYSLNSNCKIEILAKSINTGTCNFFGVYKDYSSFCVFQQAADNCLGAQYYRIATTGSSNGRIVSSVIGYIYFHKLVLDKNILYVDDILIGSKAKVDFVCNDNALLFGLTNKGAFSPSSAIIKYFKLWDCDMLVRDFIPVRVGNVGYMYDKISGKLFGNQGTGDFILGPDKA